MLYYHSNKPFKPTSSNWPSPADPCSLSLPSLHRMTHSAQLLQFSFDLNVLFVCFVCSFVFSLFCFSSPYVKRL